MKRVAAPLVAGFALALGAAVGAVSSPALADSGFRCPTGRLVLTGDRLPEVQAKCGDPDYATQRTEKRTVQVRSVRWLNGTAQEVIEEREIDILIDEWTYDMGPRRFTQSVTFENGRVAFTDTGNRGSRTTAER